MEYIELECSIQPVSETNIEILIAELSNIGYESFMETYKGVIASIKSLSFNAENIEFVIKTLPFRIDYKYHIVKEENWNQLWEKNYSPVVIKNSCIIKAPFHTQTERFKYNIVIEPKMTFGTGHHETTKMMVEEILTMVLKNKKVLDMGSGTGILAILAEKKGANKVIAIDNDERAYQNILDNILINNTYNVRAIYGNSNSIQESGFDLILANINTDVLLSDISTYSSCLDSDGIILISGFIEKDTSLIIDHARLHNLKPVKKRQKGSWIMVKLKKSL